MTLLERKNHMSDFFESLKQSTRASRDVVTRTRGFELVSGEFDHDLLPKRGTAHAAGYDLKASQEITIEPGEIELVPTGVKAICCLKKGCTCMTVAQILGNADSY